MGSIGFLPDFEFCVAALGVPSGPMALVAASRFKTTDSQSDSSNMGPVPTDFHDLRLFRKSCHGFLARYLSCFRSNSPKVYILRFLVGTQKMRGEQLHRFVVVSPWEVPSLPFSCPFKILIFRPFLKPLLVFLSPSPQKVYTNYFRQPYENI